MEIAGAIAGPLIGGLLGDSGSSQSQSTQQTLDPRMESAIYGDGGLLAGARDWYAANRAGLNSQMLEGMNNQYAQLGASTQGYNRMQQLGMGLMGGGVAGNPFAGGYRGGTDFSGGLNGNGGGMAPSVQQYQPAAFNQLAGSAGGNSAAAPFSMPAPVAPTAPAAPVFQAPVAAVDPSAAYWGN